MAKHKANLSCFAAERKHKFVKAIANHTFRHIESHVVGRMLVDFLDDITEPTRFQDVFLINPVDVSNLLPGFVLGALGGQLYRISIGGSP